MSSPPSSPDPSRPVERFKPTSGVLLGYTGLAATVFLLGYVVVYARSVDGLRLALGAVLFGLLVWVSQLRPRATAYRRHVVLKNMVRDAHVPLAAVDEISVGQTLNLWVGEKRYVCIGIGNSIREEVRSRRRRDQPLGTSRLTEFALRADRANNDERAMSYQTFVVTRLEELVDEARRETRGQEAGQARYVLAWPEVAALSVTTVAFLVTLLL
ncbi:hypothetical protein [Nocardioides mesophilus]|uniref:PH domain-containing protein n=1 Tax=Nocardioides mesophilus TaxID=433659 RepID=A0A7G9RDL3_9ACTN|nr:hypothetical protein [Nocardioides mesophilus]QNN53688.1 hypothetical protein H9L09_04520 [Nocardioides mesophilus]